MSVEAKLRALQDACRRLDKGHDRLERSRSRKAVTAALEDVRREVRVEYPTITTTRRRVQWGDRLNDLAARGYVSAHVALGPEERTAVRRLADAAGVRFLTYRSPVGYGFTWVPGWLVAAYKAGCNASEVRTYHRSTKRRAAFMAQVALESASIDV